MQRPVAGSVALKVLNVILLKADAVLRAKVIASNSEEFLLITPAEMRKSNGKKKKKKNRKMTYQESLTEAETLNERPHPRDLLRFIQVLLEKHRIVYRPYKRRLSFSSDTLFSH